MDGVLHDDQNPYITAGLNYRAALEYDSAINAFEKALEENPHSVRAHYELGLLYDKEKRDYVTGIYHYNRVLKLQPTGYPSDNVRLLIAGCRQELIKAEALAPVARSMQNELEKLRRENQELLDRIENLKVQHAASLAQAQAQTQHQLRAEETTAPVRSRSSEPVRTVLAPPPQRPFRPNTTSPTTTVPPPTTTARSHTVRAGETLASISRSYGVSLTALTAANPGIDPRRIRPGQVIRLPRR